MFRIKKFHNSIIFQMLISFALCIISALSLLAQSPQPNEMSFWHLGTLQGLSSNNVKCIIKDKDGFVWIGTNNGLNRFDGYNFKVFRNKYSDSLSIGGNNINAFFIDNQNNFWIATTNGISQYDPISGVFFNYKINVPYNQNKKLLVGCFFQDTKQNIWIGTNNGLYELKIENRKLLYNHVEDTKNISVNNIVEYKNSLLLAAWGMGVLKLDLGTHKYEQIFYDSTSLDGNRNRIFNLFVDKEERLWIGNVEGKVIIFDLKSRKRIGYSPKSDKPLDLSPVHAFCGTGDKIWIATERGLEVYSNKYNFTSIYLNNPFNPSSLSTNYITNIYNDSQGIYWISVCIATSSC